MFPNSDYARNHLALALSQKGLHDEAIEEFLKIETVTSWHWYLGYIYGAAGENEKALEVLNYYLELSKSEFVWLSNFTFIYAGMGETHKAMEWLEKTYEQREAWMDLLQVEPMYDNLRSDPRFQDLLEKMNYPD
jgi:tetratricopeptide (TPR) repeat protein